MRICAVEPFFLNVIWSIPLCCIICYNKSPSINTTILLCLLTDFYYNILIQHNGMDHIKLLACQAYSINSYRNIRTKIMKCCTNIHFNHQCLIRNLIPNYARFKVPYNSPASQMTEKKVHIIRIKDEIKFLNKKILFCLLTDFY